MIVFMRQVMAHTLICSTSVQVYDRLCQELRNAQVQQEAIWFEECESDLKWEMDLTPRTAERGSPDDCPLEDWSGLLTKWERQNVDKYLQMRTKACATQATADTRYCFCISQDAKEHPSTSHADGSLPTYLHGAGGITRIWSPRRSRWLTTKEKRGAQLSLPVSVRLRLCGSERASERASEQSE